MIDETWENMIWILGLALEVEKDTIEVNKGGYKFMTLKFMTLKQLSHAVPGQSSQVKTVNYYLLLNHLATGQMAMSNWAIYASGRNNLHFITVRTQAISNQVTVNKGSIVL